MSEEANASTDATEAAAQATAEGADANVTAPADQAQAAAEASQDKGADGKAAEAAEGGDAEAFALAAPEGAEAFQADFDAFAGEMDTWLKANPNATAREALTEAAMRQARVAGDAQSEMQKAAAAYSKQVSDWGDALEKDAEFGGEKYQANVATYIKAVEKFGGEDLRQRLDQSGLGNHPGIVKAFFALGKDMADTEVVTGQAGTSTRRSFADALYGNGNGKD